jgi:hypothetical protein
MRSLNHRQVFIDTVPLYFAPLVGAIRGAISEVKAVESSIAAPKSLEHRSGHEASSTAEPPNPGVDLK